MNDHFNAPTKRASRIIGLGLLTASVLTRNGSPSQMAWYGGIGWFFGIWCLIEIIRSYFHRQS